MPRVPKAMKALIAEVESVFPGVSVKVSEPDGFKVYRVVKFSDVEGLTAVLDSLRADKRIKSVEDLEVEFVTTVRADDAAVFGVGAVVNTLFALPPELEGDEEEASEEPSLEDRLNKMKVAEIREEFGYSSEWKKADIIADILADTERL